MVRNVFKADDQLAIALPDEAIERLGLREGSQVEVLFDSAAGGVRLARAEPGAADIDPEFARQLDAFIAHYRPALVALAR